MNTAELVADGLAGYPGPASLYRIDPPMAGTDHLLLFHQRARYGQSGQLVVILAREDGLPYHGDVRPTVGSHATDDPNHHLALQLAGGYRIVEPQPEPEHEGDDAA